MNKVILAGRLTHDPELKQTTTGTQVTSFNVAVNRRFAKEGEQSVDFLPVIAWRQTADFVCRYFKKGSSVCVVGTVQTRSWKDQNGNNRHATEIIADEVLFVDGKNDAQSQNASQNEYTQISVPNPPPQNVPKFEELKTDDDLPF
jgi:single-strand DNA-binding protein